MNSDLKPYVFCDCELSSYEKTIIILALAYGRDPAYVLEEDDIYDLACFLEVNYELLKQAITCEVELPFENVKIQFGSDVVDCGEYFKNDFFRVIINIYILYKNVNNLSSETDDESVIHNIRLFNAITALFDIVNAITATYECMIKNAFSYDNTIFDSPESFYPKSYIDMLIMLKASDDCLDYDHSIISLIVSLLKYEFSTRINSLYLITICQILKHSPCFDEDMTSIANELYNKLLSILKSGRIISINVNSMYFDESKPKSLRTKRDNTTRLQLVYGYSNYDCYELRLDFAHKGQEFVHFNNETPGGTSCCILSNSEFERVLEEFPDMKDCFISYEGKWALKERNNCELNDEQNHAYDKICKNKSHDSVFLNDYSEDKINEFILIMANMLPKDCRRPIDTDGEYARYCFNLDILNRDATLLYLASISSEEEQIERIYDSIADKEFRYGLCKTKRKINSFSEVLKIIYNAESRIKGKNINP